MEPLPPGEMELLLPGGIDPPPPGKVELLLMRDELEDGRTELEELPPAIVAPFATTPH